MDTAMYILFVTDILKIISKAIDFVQEKQLCVTLKDKHLSKGYRSSWTACAMLTGYKDKVLNKG